MLETDTDTDLVFGMWITHQIQTHNCQNFSSVRYFLLLWTVVPTLGFARVDEIA